MTKTVVFIAGHKGMVGSAILRKLTADNQLELIIKTKQELDLCDQAAVMDFFQSHKINHVYLAAAKVGGILANNNYPADFIYQNLQIQNNVIHAANVCNVNKLLFLGSSCIYPKFAEQPIIEESLLTGSLEPTNEPYAIAKIAGIKLCESINRQYNRDYRCVMPTNLYGPGDNYNPDNSHVIPGLIGRFHRAKINNDPEVVVWGTGTPRREFLYVDDLAEAAIQIMNLPNNIWSTLMSHGGCHINVGYGKDISIAELAALIAKAISYSGKIIFDSSKPDGTPIKLLDVTKINLINWYPKINLISGLENTYKHYQLIHKN
jgi:GDP-L-fucose synthase